MFRLLAIITLLVLPVSFTHAKLTVPEPEYGNHYEEEYTDGQYSIHIESMQALNPTPETKKEIYGFFSGEDGRRETVSFAKSFQPPEMPLKQAFYLPGKAKYVLLYTDDIKPEYKILVNYTTEALQFYYISFQAQGKPEDIRAFLASPVAQRTLKKAHIPFSKKDIRRLKALENIDSINAPL